MPLPAHLLNPAVIQSQFSQGRYVTLKAESLVYSLGDLEDNPVIKFVTEQEAITSQRNTDIFKAVGLPIAELIIVECESDFFQYKPKTSIACNWLQVSPYQSGEALDTLAKKNSATVMNAIYQHVHDKTFVPTIIGGYIDSKEHNIFYDIEKRSVSFIDPNLGLAGIDTNRWSAERQIKDHKTYTNMYPHFAGPTDPEMVIEQASEIKSELDRIGRNESDSYKRNLLQVTSQRADETIQFAKRNSDFLMRKR